MGSQKDVTGRLQHRGPNFSGAVELGVRVEASERGVSGWKACRRQLSDATKMIYGSELVTSGGRQLTDN